MERRPIWLWPNLLSLDAPLVAVAWLWIFARTWGVVWFPKSIYLLVAGAVWMIYVIDRLLDTRVLPGSTLSGKPRHQFHHRHRKKFGVAVGIVGLVCLWILLNLPPDLWSHGSFVMLFVAAYFLLVFLQNNEGVSYFKNVMAGMAFAYGTVVGMHFYRPSSSLFTLIFQTPEVLVFAVLCIANITAIDFWEQARKSSDEDESTAYEVVLSLLLIIVAGFALLMAMKADRYTQPFYYAIMVGAALLHVVNRARTLFSVDTMRVLADLAMLLPFPVFLIYPLFDRWMN